MGPASLALRLVHRPRTGPGPLALCLGTVTVGLSLAVGLDADSSPARYLGAATGVGAGLLTVLAGLDRRSRATRPASRPASDSTRSHSRQ